MQNVVAPLQTTATLNLVLKSYYNLMLLKNNVVIPILTTTQWLRVGSKCKAIFTKISEYECGMNAVSMNVVSMNVMSMNVVSMNVVSMNVVSMNVVSMNVVSMNVVSMNVSSMNVVSINVTLYTFTVDGIRIKRQKNYIY